MIKGRFQSLKPTEVQAFRKNKSMQRKRNVLYMDSAPIYLVKTITEKTNRNEE